MSSVRYSQSGDSTTSRSRLIIGLLVMVLLLVLGLAWQANQTMRSHRATTTSVLQDYARVSADEFVRNAMAQIGFYGYYTLINLQRRQAFEDSDVLLKDRVFDADTTEARAKRLANHFFELDMRSEQIATSGDELISPEIEDYLLRRGSDLLLSPLPESGLVIDHTVLGDEPYTFVMSTDEASDRVFGFEVNRDELSRWLRQTFDDAPLLPESLADGAISNDFIYLRFDDSKGRALFQSRQDYDPYLLVSKLVGNEYEGIFESFQVTASIDPVIAEMLVIGGLPRSRLPVLFAVILLTVGLLIAAILQLRREHALMKLRTDFVSEVSHELRTPLAQIRIFAESLLFKRLRSAEDERRALEIIDRESRRLTNLVENVLEFSGQSNGERELHFTHTVLAPLIGDIIDEFQPLANSVAARVETELDPGAAAPVDKDALRQMLLNLLDNAVKYGPAEQCVQVSLSAPQGRIEIGVSDQGPGIPRSEREKIWRGYYRLDRERQSAIAGTGIGLSVVRETVNRHGGRIRVEDAVGGGARFVIEIPTGNRP